MCQAPECPSTKDRRHFAYQKAGELWMSDVMHGPAVVVSGRRKQKTYLIGLIDDAIRVVPYGVFALSESTSAYLPVLRQGVMRRGIPLRLYVDNGAAFRSHHLALVCARLGITLIHARPYQPAGKGKQERFFRTVRMRFLPTLGPADLGSLDALNRRFWAWVEGEYHRAPHRGLDDMTPLDAWAMRSGDVRAAGPEFDLTQMCLLEGLHGMKGATRPTYLADPSQGAEARRTEAAPAGAPSSCCSWMHLRTVLRPSPPCSRSSPAPGWWRWRCGTCGGRSGRSRRGARRT